MKLHTYFPLFFIGFCFPLFSQEAMTIKHACNFAADTTSSELYTYNASKEATDIIDKVMKANVLPQNFIIKAADCANALATTEGKQRYILYSTAFLENFKHEANSQWAAYCVLAHEIGHHLSNHDLEETTPSVRKRFELEADKFAGGVLFKLGASLEEAQSGIKTFATDNVSTTHPPKRARLEAVAIGWKQAEESAETVGGSTGVAVKDSDEKKLYDQAKAEPDAIKAVELLDKAIELKENYTEAYLLRGQKKLELGNNTNAESAIEDFNYVLQMQKNNANAFLLRGDANRILNKDKEAFADINRAIQINAKSPDAYLQRAWIRQKFMASGKDVTIGDEDKIIADLDKALALKPDFIDALDTRGHYFIDIGENSKAIADFDKILKIKPDTAGIYQSRATAKFFQKQYAETIADLDKVEKLLGKDFDDFFTRAQCYQALKKHNEAIHDFDTILKTQPDNSSALMYRGVSNFALNKKTEAQADFEKAVESTILKDIQKAKIGCELVKFAFYKEALIWLNAALEDRANDVQKAELEIAKDCKLEALKNIKK